MDKEKQRAYSATWRKANPEKARARNAVWRKANPEKAKASSAAWRKAHPEKEKTSNAAWRKANREVKKASSAIWYKANREKALEQNAAWCKAHPEERKASKAAWDKANPESKKIHDHNRRARKISNGGKLSKGISEKLLLRQKGKCAICKKSVKKTGYHLDHIIPLALGGKNEDGNIQILCPTCNQRKHTKDPIKFAQEMGYLL